MDLAPHRTFRISSPIATHYRPASCADVDCSAHLHGWRTTVDIGTDLGREQAAYIRAHAGRRHVEPTEDGRLVAFTFEPGQVCFAAADHRVPLDRPEIFRTSIGPALGVDDIVHTLRPDQWVDDFATHLDGIRAARESLT